MDQSPPHLAIYVVEDSLLIQERLMALLSPLPGICIVGMSATAGQAIQDISSRPADVVILDLKLADGSGMRVLRHLKQQRPAVVVIVLTNNILPYIRNACLNEGASYFLDKTTDFPNLPGLLQTLSVKLKH